MPIWPKGADKFEVVGMLDQRVQSLTLLKLGDESHPLGFFAPQRPAPTVDGTENLSGPPQEDCQKIF